MKAVVLCGGKGTRLRPITFTRAKQLIPIANKPILFYGLEALAEAGLKHIGLVVGDTEEEFHEAVGNGSAWGLEQVEYIRQSEPLGLAHAVNCAKGFTGNDPFIVYLGDNVIQEGVRSFVQAFQKHKPSAMILLSAVAHPERFGVAELKEGKVFRLEEKPKKPKSNLALVGVYLFTPVIYDAIAKLSPSWRGEYEITEAIQNLIDEGKEVQSHIITGWWKDTGKVEDLLEANSMFLQGIAPRNEGEVDEKSWLEGKVAIGAGAIITQSVLRGPVIVGRHCVISRSYIGPFTSIGNGVEIEDSELQNSIILEGAKVHGISRMDSSLIGKECEVFRDATRPQRMSFVLGDKSIARVL